jgi:hypothetical protein
MVGICPTILVNLLGTGADVVHKSISLERPAISEVRLHNDAMIHRCLFKVLFSSNCFNRRKTKLVFHSMSVARSMIDKYTASSILIGQRLTVGVVGAS